MISKKTNSILIKSIVITIVLTIFEYIVSLVLELIFGIRWWDYSNEFLNINGRVCLTFSVIWWIGTAIFLKFFYEPLQKLILKVRKKVTEKPIIVISIILTVITLVDFVFSVIRVI